MQVGHLKKVNFIEKILRDKEGRLVRATFCVYESAGRIKARLIDVVYLEEKSISGKVISLVGLVRKVSSPRQRLGHKLVSPYLTFEILYFGGSKPRAPTFV